MCGDGFGVFGDGAVEVDESSWGVGDVEGEGVVGEAAVSAGVDEGSEVADGVGDVDASLVGGELDGLGEVGSGGVVVEGRWS